MGSTTKFFGTVRQKVLTENRDISPPPSYPYLFFETRNFQKHRSERSLYETYRHCETKFSTQNRDITLEPKIFQYPKIMTHWWIPYEVFRQSDKKFWQKIVIFPPPLLSVSFFETRNFQKHRSERFLYEIFRHCETKFLTQNLDITLWSLKSFETRN